MVSTKLQRSYDEFTPFKLMSRIHNLGKFVSQGFFENQNDSKKRLIK